MLDAAQIKVILTQVMDPDLDKDIVSLGYVKDILVDKSGIVTLKIKLKDPQSPHREDIYQQVKQRVSSLKGVSNVQILAPVTPKVTVSNESAPLDVLAQVSTVLMVSSCKGGVGKSSMAVNIASALSKQGNKVGIFDADVYGPSLPTMMAVDSDLKMQGDLIIPFEYEGIKLMSFGYVNSDDPESGPAILRGPMVAQVIQQLLLGTLWGELDYLVIDMPPGTGDIQLSLAQLTQITAAVMVTTPQYLSLIDVVKGIEMFDRVNIPTIGVVENMSYLELPENQKSFPFGRGALTRLIREFGFKTTLKFPIHPTVSAAGDEGEPWMFRSDTGPLQTLMMDFVNQLCGELERVRLGQLKLPKVSYEPDQGILIFPEDEPSFSVDPKQLRLACQSALNRDEFTGELRQAPDDIPDTIRPLSMNPVGNYALGIQWSDGHSSLFPYQQLLEMASQ